MMQMQTAIWEETIRFEPEPHVLAAFFELRHIPKRGVARRLGVTYEMIRLWLNGYMKPTKKREAQLQAFKNEVLQWEAEHGCMFDGRIKSNPQPEPQPIIRKAIKK